MRILDYFAVMVPLLCAITGQSLVDWFNYWICNKTKSKWGFFHATELCDNYNFWIMYQARYAISILKNVLNAWFYCWILVSHYCDRFGCLQPNEYIFRKKNMYVNCNSLCRKCKPYEVARRVQKKYFLISRVLIRRTFK